MGWKNVKEHYRIEHQVQVTEAGICIGSPYIHNIMVIGFDGNIKKKYGKPASQNANLFRYSAEMEADPGKLRELVQTPDTFNASIPVYTYDGGEIIEKQCEEPGWLNTTHDGAMMYENTFFARREDAVVAAKKNAEYGIEFALEHIAEAERQLVEWQGRLAVEKAALAKLDEA